MNIKYIYKILAKTIGFNKLPGNRYEKQALIEILKYQVIVFFVSIIVFMLILTHSSGWIYLIPFLYAAFSILDEAIPIVLQDQHAPNRFIAPTTLMLIFIYTLFICLIGAGVSMYFDLHLIFLFLMVGLYIRCIYFSIKYIK